jgi:hypothetical protein
MQMSEQTLVQTVKQTLKQYVYVTEKIGAPLARP